MTPAASSERPASILFTIMANRTHITVTFLPAQKETFEEYCEVVYDDEIPGLLVGGIEEAVPADLDEIVQKIPDAMFIGFYGSHGGDYVAARFIAPGNGNIFTHPCDEAGNLSMPDISLDSLGNIPLGFSSLTLEFIITYRSVRAKMLDAAAAHAENRLKEIEAEEAAIKEQKLRKE